VSPHEDNSLLRIIINNIPADFLIVKRAPYGFSQGYLIGKPPFAEAMEGTILHLLVN
jgi:hypothetical protein